MRCELKIIIAGILIFIIPIAVFGGFPHNRDPGSFDPDFFDDTEKVVEDLVDIAILDREVLAIIDGESIVSQTLDLNEEVLIEKTEGLMGVVMTNKRLLAISSFTSTWIELQLNLMEVEDEKKPEVLISDFLILVVTSNRLLGFDSKGSNWIKKDIILHDKIIAVEIDKRVAVVVTTDRALGLAVGSAFFDSIRFMKGEEVISVETRPSNANVLTNKRLLIFRSTGALWKEFDKDFY